MIHVVTTGYNCAAFAPYTIQSILNQRCREEFMVHLVDDGSDSEQHQLLMDIADDHFRTYFLQDNHGAAYARHAAFTGWGWRDDDIIVLIDLDGDEFAHELVLQRVQWEYEHDPELDMTYGSYQFKSPFPRGAADPWPWGVPTPYPEGADFYKDPWHCFPLRTFRARMLKQVPRDSFIVDGEWVRCSTDVALMLPIMATARKMKWIDEVLYLYNHHPRSTLNTYANKREINQKIRAKGPPAHTAIAHEQNGS